MTRDEEAVVESMARLLTDAGIPRIAGRMWAWLLICEPPQQTAADLAESLGASRGSVSGAARLLQTAGLVTRSARRGDRRDYFSVPPGSMVEIMRSREPAVTAWRRLADQGLELLKDRTPEQQARLREVRDLYAFMERELPAMLERYVEHRKERTT
jgi:DNA-binding transcriptional regulator GbsR (MarR family)